MNNFNEITNEQYEIDYSNPLSEWIGKSIVWIKDRRTCRVKRETVKLIAVCKDRLIVEETWFDGMRYLGFNPLYKQVELGKDFVNATDSWALYEEQYPGPERDPQYLHLILTNRI